MAAIKTKEQEKSKASAGKDEEETSKDKKKDAAVKKREPGPAWAALDIPHDSLLHRLMEAKKALIKAPPGYRLAEPKTRPHLTITWAKSLKEDHERMDKVLQKIAEAKIDISKLKLGKVMRTRLPLKHADDPTKPTYAVFVQFLYEKTCPELRKLFEDVFELVPDSDVKFTDPLDEDPNGVKDFRPHGTLWYFEAIDATVAPLSARGIDTILMAE